jgi:hypothetical protein
MAVQVVALPQDLPVAMALVIFFRSFGGAIGLDFAQLIFSPALIRQLSAVPGTNSTAFIHMGAAEISQKVNPNDLGLIRESYTRAISETLIQRRLRS